MMKKWFKKMTSVLLALLITMTIWTAAPISTTAASIAETEVSADYSKESIVYFSGDSYVHVAGFLNNSYIDVYKYEDIYYKIDMDNELFPDCKIDMKVSSIDTGKESTVNIKQHTDSSEQYIRKGYYYYVPINISGYSGRINLSIILTFANGQVYYDSNNIVKLNLCSSSSVQIASGKCGDNLTWTLFQDGVMEINGSGAMYDYELYVEDKYTPWREYRQEIKQLIINEGVTSIGKNAFYGRNIYTENTLNDSIESVLLPNTLETIGASSFEGCFSLRSITMPNSITTIGYRAFLGCKSLSTITVSNQLTKISEECFSFSGIEQIVLPPSIQKIEYSAFSNCKNLKEVEIKSNSISIKEGYIFKNCTSLYKVTFKGMILSDSSYGIERLFENCTNLTYLTVPSVNTNGEKEYPIQTNSNFLGCDSLRLDNITFNDNKVKVINDVLFSNDEKSLVWYPDYLENESYIIPSGVERLSVSAFQGNEYIKHVVIPDSVNLMEYNCFWGCKNLNYVIIPEKITEISQRAFASCDSLKNIVIPPSVITIDYNIKNSTASFTSSYSPLSIDTVFGENNTQAETLANWTKAELKNIVYCNFDANEGHVSQNQQAVIPQDKYWVLPTPTRNGYEFDGWYTNKTGGTKITEESIVTPESSFTLYAHWISKGDITKPSVVISSSNDVSASQTVTLILNDNVGIKGYYWGTSSSYSNNTYTATSNTSISKTVDSAGTYYATAVDTSGNVSATVSITFYKTTLNANGGSVSTTSVLTKSGNSFTFPTPTRNNYTYTGWAKTTSSTSTIKTLKPTSNEIYYAIWE